MCSDLSSLCKRQIISPMNLLVGNVSIDPKGSRVRCEVVFVHFPTVEPVGDTCSIEMVVVLHPNDILHVILQMQ